MRLHRTKLVSRGAPEADAVNRAVTHAVRDLFEQAALSRATTKDAAHLLEMQEAVVRKLVAAGYDAKQSGRKVRRTLVREEVRRLREVFPADQ